MPRRFRTLFLSDTHLGSGSARAHDLLAFLDAVTADTIYLAGDIIDFARMDGHARFPVSHSEAWLRLTQLAATGTRIVYVPGNYDESVRRYAGQAISGIEVALEAEHETAAGERLLVIHGDELDAAVREGTDLPEFGAASYRWLEEADEQFTRLGDLLGKQFTAISLGVRLRLEKAREYIHRFESFCVAHARSRGFDGIVCGHLHRPELRRIDGILYANDGDWIEHRSALVEDESGELSLLHYDAGSVLSYAGDPLDSLAA